MKPKLRVGMKIYWRLIKSMRRDGKWFWASVISVDGDLICLANKQGIHDITLSLKLIDWKPDIHSSGLYPIYRI